METFRLNRLTTPTVSKEEEMGEWCEPQKEWEDLAMETSACSRLVDCIVKIRPWFEQSAATEAVDKIPDDQLEGAWAWTATYLVALERRISSEKKR